jgi:hypothetical protein
MADVPQPTQVRADYVKEMVHTGETGALAPPRNLDVPYVSGDGTVGATLNCTMGNWGGQPTDYAYAWKSDGADVAGSGNSYVVAPSDAGHSITCVVTATNAAGSTAAPPSNAIAVAAA